ncbi:MAG TPA: hypothetical protein VFH08_05085 [Chitinophagaceae bacterium]|nr:hypothetical protein [Chitinophagaceae bacterium]
MYILAEVVPDFVKILGYGLSGFAFLLMFFAYMLLRQAINKSTQNKMIIKSIWAFMGLSFLLTITIGVFSFITGDYKQKELANNEATIKTQQNGLEILNADQKLDSLVKKGIVENMMNNPEKAEEAKRAHDKIIAELETRLDSSNATPEDKRKFESLKGESVKTLDSLSKPDLSPETKTRLRNRYLFQTAEISKVSSTVVKRNMIISGAVMRRQP